MFCFSKIDPFMNVNWTTAFLARMIRSQNTPGCKMLLLPFKQIWLRSVLFPTEPKTSYARNRTLHWINKAGIHMLSAVKNIENQWQMCQHTKPPTIEGGTSAFNKQKATWGDLTRYSPQSSCQGRKQRENPLAHSFFLNLTTKATPYTDKRQEPVLPWKEKAMRT